MADEIDKANELAELELISSLNKHQNKQINSPQATGECLYCYAELPDGQRWCDMECRDEWERETKRKQERGWT